MSLILPFLVTSLLTAPPSADADPRGLGRPPPSVPTVKKALVIGGAATLGTAYLAAVALGVVTEVVYAPRPGLGGVNPFRPLFVPLVGPALVVAKPGTTDTAGVVVFLTDTALQLAGAALLVTALLLPAPRLPLQAWVAPVLHRDGAGAMLGMAF